jgi:hypothetical protein
VPKNSSKSVKLTRKPQYTENNTTIKLSATSYTYTGKALKPTVSVKDSNGKKINAKYYTVTYKNNTKVGKATLTIKFKNGYVGTIKKTFKINPKATLLKKVSSAKTISKLSAKKTYYVRIRTYKTVSGKKYYSDWSKALPVKTK